MQMLVARRDQQFAQLGIDAIDLSTHDDFTPKLHKFFRQRARRAQA